MVGKQDIRVRIAPSPTGHLHLGTVRTALYNYLFAQKEHGTFILRVEDTDQGRSLPIYENEILDGLRALGLTWQEGPDVGGPHGPYRQTERTQIYKTYIEKLLTERKAYYCFCTKEDLEKQREAMLVEGIAPKYAGTCRSLSAQQVQEKLAAGASSVIRLLVSDGVEVSFDDVIRGSISVMSNTIGDMVIAKNVNTPLFHLANVVDDYEMKISHVIRGEDHISNTPKQILIQQAFGFPRVRYAHIPLVLTPDRKKMSKRSLETSFVEYLHDGYLPEALLNFLALLGWAPEDGSELLTLPEMVERFSLKRIQKSGAAFNIDKLDWFNAQYIKKLSFAELVQRLTPFVPPEWLLQNNHLMEHAINLERERIKKLSDFVEGAGFLFSLGEYETSLLVWKGSTLAQASAHLAKIRELLDSIEPSNFTATYLESVIMPYAQQVGRGEVLWPLRVALSGKQNSPGPFDILAALGKEESLRRIDIGVAKVAGELSLS